MGGVATHISWKHMELYKKYKGKVIYKALPQNVSFLYREVASCVSLKPIIIQGSYASD